MLNRFKLISALFSITVMAPVAVLAQAPACAPAAPACATAPAPGVVATAPAAGQSDGLERDVLVKRGIGLAAVGFGGAYVANGVSHAARGLVDFGHVRDVPVYGDVAVKLPLVGHAVARGSLVPTTIGEVPVMGAVVSKVPIVGHVIAGPANPILVGAVAVDTYVIPKYSPCGYTKSSIVAGNNDFNTPPKLRSYVNYLAPLPYTHPPIYSAKTINTDLPANKQYIAGLSVTQFQHSVDLPQ
jgi:hypothetical protein